MVLTVFIETIRGRKGIGVCRLSPPCKSYLGFFSFGRVIVSRTDYALVPLTMIQGG
jgi:hypothetical protein